MGFKGDRNLLLQSPQLNAYYAGKYLRYQLDRYREAYKAVCAYNFGHWERGSSRCLNEEYLLRVEREWK